MARPRLLNRPQTAPYAVTQCFGLPLRPGCGAGAPVPAKRQTNSGELSPSREGPVHRTPKPAMRGTGPTSQRSKLGPQPARFRNAERSRRW